MPKNYDAFFTVRTFMHQYNLLPCFVTNFLIALHSCTHSLNVCCFYIFICKTVFHCLMLIFLLSSSCLRQRKKLYFENLIGSVQPRVLLRASRPCCHNNLFIELHYVDTREHIYTVMQIQGYSSQTIYHHRLQTPAPI